MKVLLIIPAYNEEKNIGRVTENLQEFYPEYDYIVVNDGSKDETAKICRQKNIPLLDLPVNLGLTGAFQTGVKYGVAHGYDCVLQFDGDGQHRAEYIKPMLEKMEEGYDIVIGSRFLHRKKPKNFRMIGSRLIGGAICLTTGQRIKDPTSGMRLFNRNMMERFAAHLNYSPEPDTISYLIKTGVRVAEVPVEMDERIAGDSYLNFVRSCGYMLRTVVSILFIQNFRKEREP